MPLLTKWNDYWTIYQYYHINNANQSYSSHHFYSAYADETILGLLSAYYLSYDYSNSSSLFLSINDKTSVFNYKHIIKKF